MATQACTEDTRALPIPILKVNTLREAHLRISWLVALVCLVALSGLLAALWEVLALNPSDRDFRDLLFDARVNNAARQCAAAFAHDVSLARLNHVYFNKTLPWLAVAELPDAPAAISKAGPPMLQLVCRDVKSASCAMITAQLQAALGTAPVDCSRRGGVVWNGRPVADAAITTVDGALAACILRVYVAGAEMPALRLELATVASPTTADALRLVEKVNAQYGSGRWSPAQGPVYPRVAGQKLRYQRITTQGDNRRKWGFEDDLATFKTCPDTAWSATYWTRTLALQSPAYEPGVVQTVPVEFSGSAYEVPFFQVSWGVDDVVTVSRITGLELQLAMVSPTPCDGWRLAHLRGAWDEIVFQGSVEDAATHRFTAASATVDVVVRDLSQPQPLRVPEYDGQFFIIVAVACAALTGALSIAYGVSWFIALWNVRVSCGKSLPWWAMPYNRGW